MKSLFKNIGTIPVLFWVSSFFLLFVLFLFLQPKIAASLFYERRVETLGDFITTIKVTDDISPREYWEFREFYMPGTASFRKEGVLKQSLPENLTRLLPDDVTSYLLFTSEKIQSIDGLGSPESFSEIKQRLTQLNDVKIISESDTHILVSVGNTYYLSFIKSQEVLKDTTGIFQYWAVSENNTDSSWINLTQIDS